MIATAIFVDRCSCRQKVRSLRLRRLFADPLSTNNLKGAPCSLMSWHSTSPSSSNTFLAPEGTACVLCHSGVALCSSNTVGAVAVAPVARKANVPFSSLRVAPDLDQNHALIVLDLRIGLDGVRRQLPCQRPRSCHRRSHLQVSFTKVLKIWGVTAWPSKLGSHLPGYGICFQIDSPWISSGTNSMQPPRSGAFQDMAFASELTRHGFRRAQNSVQPPRSGAVVQQDLVLKLMLKRDCNLHILWVCHCICFDV